MNFYQCKYFTLLCLLAIGTGNALPASADPVIDEIIISADFRAASAQTTPASISIVSEARLIDRTAKHLEDVLNIAANVNSAAGASRGRFFQIRGIGERSQFKEPLDSSVGW